MNPVSPAPWSLWQKLLFRFFALYFFLYTFPFPLDLLPFTDTLSGMVYEDIWMPLVQKAGAWLHIQGLEDSSPNGSGDTTWNYVQLLVILLLTLVGWLIWSVADHRRRHYDRLLYWFSVYVRYALAAAMLSYGWVKVYKSQFPHPSLNNLLQSYGQSSPMRLAWTFMGYSDAYNLFTGGAELLAGFLLFFRRTRLLGALLGVTVMANVVAINFCFDVPVKLYSSHLLLMALFIAAPDFRSLYRFFILHIPAAPTGKLRPFSGNRKLKTGLGSLKCLFIVYILYTGISTGLEAHQSYGDGATKPPLWGIYNVETFVKNKDTLAPLVTDPVRWRRFVTGHPGTAVVYSMNDSKTFWNLRPDTTGHNITLEDMYNVKSTWWLHYSQPDSQHLVFTGTNGKDSIFLLMRKEPADSFMLINRGFHWINEYPYNK